MVVALFVVVSVALVDVLVVSACIDLVALFVVSVALIGVLVVSACIDLVCLVLCTFVEFEFGVVGFNIFVIVALIVLIVVAVVVISSSRMLVVVVLVSVAVLWCLFLLGVLF